MIRKTFKILGGKYGPAYEEAVQLWKDFVVDKFDAEEPQSWPAPLAIHYNSEVMGKDVWLFEFEDDITNVEPGWS